MTPAVYECQKLLDASVQTNPSPQGDSIPEVSHHSQDRLKLLSKQPRESGNPLKPHGNGSEQPAHNLHPYACSSHSAIYALSSQQTASDINCTTPKETSSQVEEAENLVPTSAYRDLQQYMAGQRIVGNHALEVWRAETLHDGPLRMIPRLANPDDWFLQMATEYSRHRESDLETVRGDSHDEISE
ncbi:hypothetical protein F5Y11DRAFT_336711 [Daldinia sp. FL1419]|nr:hypothetical protein F5Y11DRAFT_336711 [Daldinia sp. FL1419]